MLELQHNASAKTDNYGEQYGIYNISIADEIRATEKLNDPQENRVEEWEVNNRSVLEGDQRTITAKAMCRAGVHDRIRRYTNTAVLAIYIYQAKTSYGCNDGIEVL